MNVLVLCEFSGVVRDAFIAQGHNAVSCDLEPSEQPGPHLIGDCHTLDYSGCDLAICFPPCTYLALSGARWFKDRQLEQGVALDFVRYLMALPVPMIAVENPIGVISSKIRKPDQIIQPWQFGHEERKATCLWLKNLPPLIYSLICVRRDPRIYMMSGNKDRAKNRSRTYSGIALAMAQQWSNL